MKAVFFSSFSLRINRAHLCMLQFDNIVNNILIVDDEKREDFKKVNIILKDRTQDTGLR